MDDFKQYYESDKNQHPLELKTRSSELSYEKLKKISDGEIGETIPAGYVDDVLKALLYPKLYFTLFAIFGINFCDF
jgi:hypothetical protein